MATQTLTQRQTDASAAASVPIEVLAGGKPTTPVILALDLGHCTGWALRSACGVISQRRGRVPPGPLARRRDEVPALPALAHRAEGRRRRARCRALRAGAQPCRRRRFARLRRLARHPHRLVRAPRHSVPGRARRHDQAAHRRQGQCRQASGDRRRPQGSASRRPTTTRPTRWRCCTGRSRRGSEASDERRHAAAARRRRRSSTGRRVYGPPRSSFAAIAARWSLVLGIDVTPAQVALCLIDLKLARLTRDPSHLDSHRRRRRLRRLPQGGDPCVARCAARWSGICRARCRPRTNCSPCAARRGVSRGSW